MKKIIVVVISFLIINSICYAYSKSFEYLASVMNIEMETVQGYKLNEEIYNAYNQFVYGNPLMIGSEQRWKDVQDGRWTKGNGKWNGSGIRGEYWILGYNYSNEYVHNHQFPVDIEPPTPPTTWRYVYLSDALDSWNDSRLYVHEEQKIYMQQAKLTRNNITYDMTVFDIGLDKAKVENYATWKTNGNIYTRRYDKSNKEWAANFIVPPMAAEASLQSKLYFSNGETYTIDKDETSISIPVEYGAEVINLTDYAKAKHVKKLYSEITVENVIVDSVEVEKTLSITNSHTININKNDYENANVIEIEVSCNSMLITEFIVDGALADTETKVITIYVGNCDKNENELKVKRESKNYKINAIPPKISKITLGREENGETVPLKKSRKTDTEFICAGQVLTIQVETKNTDYITIEFSGDKSIITFDELTKAFEWYEPRKRGVKTRFSSLKAFENVYTNKQVVTPYKEKNEKSYFTYSYVIPYQTKQTLSSWSTLRIQSRNAFEIDTNQLFTRIYKPYNVVIKAYSNEGVRTDSAVLDVFERWDTLYNRDLTPYVR